MESIAIVAEVPKSVKDAQATEPIIIGAERNEFAKCI